MIMDKQGNWLYLRVPEKWNGHSIDHILKEVWQVPRGLLHKWRMEKGVKIDGETRPWQKQLSTDETLQVQLFPEEDYGVTPTQSQLDVLFEDDHLLIVNKQANVDTHPTDKNQLHTLSNAVAWHFLQNGIKTKVRHIHRLDRDTTGAVLFAKQALAGAILDRLLEQRIIKRTYIAIVHGKLSKKTGIIDQPIGKDRHHPTRRRVSSHGQRATTQYEVLTYDQTKDFTFVKLQLGTGRTHQIRVHMSHIGHPLVGDALYGGKNGSRQALHAARLTLPHPLTGETIDVLAPFSDNPSLFDDHLIDLIK